MQYIQTTRRVIDEIIGNFNGVYTNAEDASSIVVDVERAGEDELHEVIGGVDIEEEMIYLYAS